MEVLLKVSLVFSVLGVLLLLLVANAYEPKLTSISEINDKMLEKKVKISGTILKIEDKETFQILSVKDDSGKIDVLCECGEINSTIKVNQEIFVVGKVQAYKDYLQINAEKIMEKS